MSTKLGDPDTTHPFPLPRVTIQFCTQCKWMLRAAYFAQELLSTFSTSLGEVSLQPSTTGTFIVTIVTAATVDLPDTTTTATTATVTSKVLWDRKTDGGFPETKELKRRVRNVIDPERNLGHVDKDYYPKPAIITNPTTTTDAVNATIATSDMPGTGEGSVVVKTPTQQQPTGPRWGGAGGGRGVAEKNVLLLDEDSEKNTNTTTTTTTTTATITPTSEKGGKKALAPHLMSSGSGRSMKIPPGNEAVRAKIEVANQATTTTTTTATTASSSAGGGNDNNNKCDGNMVCEDCE